MLAIKHDEIKIFEFIVDCAYIAWKFVFSHPTTLPECLLWSESAPSCSSGDTIFVFVVDPLKSGADTI